MADKKKFGKILIKLNRSSCLIGKMAIFSDGVRIGVCRSGEVKELELEFGEHVLQAIGGYSLSSKTNKLTITVSDEPVKLWFLKTSNAWLYLLISSVLLVGSSSLFAAILSPPFGVLAAVATMVIYISLFLFFSNKKGFFYQLQEW